MSNFLIEKYKNVHFIGIGGIGVSAFSQWFRKQGARVSGSNLTEEPILEVLRNQGCHIILGPHRKENVDPNTDLVIYTLAAPYNNPERKAARVLNIPELSYPEAVGELTKQKFTIAIAGAHGKSTTTSMISLMLIRAKFDPTVIVGTRLKEFNNSNFRYGRSKYFVLEADEWRGAFWNYHPNIAILTNLDREHLDFYINFRGVKSGFRKFLSNIKEDGVIIANGDDENLRNLVTTIGKKYIFYTINSPDAKLVRKVIKIPGEHNVSNSMAVLALARYLNIPKKIALDTIKSFKGSWRRFEYKGLLNGAKLYDDYAHHPTEIRLTLEAARSITPPEGRLFAVFQPHQYQRLKILFREFRRAFDFADRILILPCYMPAGRDPSGAGSKFYKLSEELAYSISKRRKYAEFAPSFEKASEILKGELKRYDVCMIFGAGDIVKIHKFLHTT